jgi:NADPH-dependent glutamate synthase beta subunit-like oxidoreductase
MTVSLTIDGRQVRVDEGATILQAIRQLGLDVPTMCSAEGVEPSASCFLCVVEVEGRPDLLPSCSFRAADGMVVITDSDGIRSARRTALELLLSDHTGDCVAPCSLACPAGLDIPGFLQFVESGEDRGALARIKERIPLPGILGRICPRYCERVCRRRESEEAIAICALKRMPADRDLTAGDPYLPSKAPATGKSVAIVGAGAAGLTAAYYLLEAGHDCTIYDARSEPGGALRYGIPEFRLPKVVVAYEADGIRRLGAEFRMGVQLGRDVALEDLCNSHDAVLLALGAGREGPPEFQGAELAQSALTFLAEVAEGARAEPGDRVVVLGDGDEAVDAARCALRLGAKDVVVLAEAPLASLSTFREYVDAAREEGVRFEGEVADVVLSRADDSLVTVRAERGGERMEVAASLVITAAPRAADLALIEQLGLEGTARGIAVDRNTLATETPGVFAAGEVVSGPGAAVRAVASGRLAALSIRQYLSGEPVVGEPAQARVTMGRLTDDERAELLQDVEQSPRTTQRTLGPEDRRRSFDEVVDGFSAEQARAEASRCLQCDCLAKDDCKLRGLATEYGARTNPYRGERRPFRRDASHPLIVYESGKCILCGLCVRIAEQAGEPLGMSFTRRGFAGRAAVPFGGSVSEGLSAETARRVAEACPTGALALKRVGTPQSGPEGRETEPAGATEGSG